MELSYRGIRSSRRQPNRALDTVTSMSGHRRKPAPSASGLSHRRGPGSPVAKIFAVLAEVARRGGTVGITELATALRLPKATVHRVAIQLEQLGYLQREPGGRRLAIAPALVGLATDLLTASARLAPRHAILEALSLQVGESCSLGVRVGYEIVYLDDVTAASPLAFHFQAGRRAPLHCTSMGKLYLARMGKQELDRYLTDTSLARYTEYTITDPQRLRALIERVAADNFASSNQEYVLGVVGAAVPVLGPERRMVAGLAVSIPAARMAYEDLPRLQPLLRDASAKLADTFIADSG